MKALIAWRKGQLVSVLSYVFMAGVLLTSLVLMGEELAHHIKSLEVWIRSAGAWVPLVAILLYALLTSLFVPDTVLGIFAGATLGLGEGLLITAAGSLLAVTLQYACSRRLLRPLIDRLLVGKPALRAIQKAVHNQQFHLQFLLRLTPLNRALASYILGAGGVGYITFMAACVGFFPSLFLEVYFGYAGKNLAKVAGQSNHMAMLHEVLMVLGVITAIVVIVIVSRIARRAIDAATIEAES